MKNFSIVMSYIKDIEKLDKITFGEKVYDEVVRLHNQELAEYKKRIDLLKKDITRAEENLNFTYNKGANDFYNGVVYAFNIVRQQSEEEHLILVPNTDTNGQPIWLQELQQRVG